MSENIIKLVQTDAFDVHFKGKHLGYLQLENNELKPGTEYKGYTSLYDLYQTDSSAYVIHEICVSDRFPENITRVATLYVDFAAMVEHFGQDRVAKRLYSICDLPTWSFVP